MPPKQAGPRATCPAPRSHRPRPPPAAQYDTRTNSTTSSERHAQIVPGPCRTRRSPPHACAHLHYQLASRACASTSLPCDSDAYLLDLLPLRKGRSLRGSLRLAIISLGNPCPRCQTRDIEICPKCKAARCQTRVGEDKTALVHDQKWYCVWPIAKLARPPLASSGSSDAGTVLRLCS